MNMRDLELHSVIKILTKQRKKPKEINERMNAVYGDVSPSYYQVKFGPSNLRRFMFRSASGSIFKENVPKGGGHDFC